jgi:beta-lactamase regulating signal transducer with metallopeptidase domain
MVAAILSWVLTYALHSTVLILAVWLACKLIPKLSLATQESLWKLALCGGILSATLQVGIGVVPPWGHFGMPAALQTEAAPTTTIASAPAPTVIRHRAGELTITATREPMAIAAAAAPASTPSAWPYVLLALVGLGSLFGLARVGVAALRLRKQLATRRDVIEDPVLETWLALCNKAELGKRVRLSASNALPSPVALVRREVCIPERAIDGLTPQQQESMLAHELAHVLRRDPAWRVAGALVEAVFFFQPLHHLVRRKLDECAEYQCDDWAARTSGTGVHLAKCLAEVAAWVEHQPSVPLASTMAGPRSPIVRRITRLLDGSKRVGELAPAWRVGAALGLLGAIAWLGPGVSSSAAASPPPGPALAAALPTTIVVEDVLADGRNDRARVRIAGSGETVQLDVAAPRPLPPPPPPAPAVPQREASDHLHIIIEGGMWWDAWPFHGPWHGHIGIDVHGLDALIEHELDHAFTDAFEDSLEIEAEAYERQAEAYESRAEAWERELEARAREAEAHERAIERSADAYERAMEAIGTTRRAPQSPSGDDDAGLIAL